MASLDEALELAARKFHIQQFNVHQKDAIQNILKEKKDVFVNLPTGYGKSLIFQALPCIFDQMLGSSGHIVLVVSPLLNLIKDQVMYLNSMGISAISISDIESEDARLEVERGKFSLVYGTPEAWLMNEKWRAMLQNTTYSKKLCALAIDEAHVIKQWGTSTNKKLAPFRDAYSRLHEFKTLTPHARMIALTATATQTTKRVIFDVLRMRNPHVVFESPNKENITYSVEYVQKDFDLELYFSWLVEELKERKETCDRTIIYCQTINQCSLLYAMLKGFLVQDNMSSDSTLLEMLHSCTPLSKKQKILQSFTEESGSVRVLIATIAFGMGIDCKAVRRVIHFGPSKNIESYAQETGRAGRDGTRSFAFLLFNGMLLSHVEGDMRCYIESEECRRSTLLNHFQSGYTPLTPLHLCCDICASKCKCELTECKRATTYPKKEAAKSFVPTRSREVSQSDIEQVHNMLKIYHKSLVTQLLNTIPHGNLNTLTDVSFLLGFSNVQIKQVLDNLKHLFTMTDVCNVIEIWDSKHCKKILQILSNVFGDVDVDISAFDERDENLDEDLLQEDWEVFLQDDDLLSMAAETYFQETYLTTSYHQLSQLAEDSLYEHNVSDPNASTDADIPTAIHDALSRISLQ